MTVLAKYQRLEAEAVWRPEPSAQRRDVIVSIGKATITINAANGTALAHWSLPAMHRLNDQDRPALYGPGDDATDTLEVTDEEMIGAIDKVLTAMQRRSERPIWLQKAAVFGGLAAVFLFLAAWLPGAIANYTASLVPPVARASIGEDIFVQMERVAGSPCSSPSGTRALATLSERLFPDRKARFHVLPSALSETAHLPEDIFLIGHKLVEDYESPDVLAGFLLAEDERRKSRAPLAGLLEASGLGTSMALLSTGRVQEDVTKRMAEWVVARPSEPVSENDLLAVMNEKRISAKAYAYAIDISGEQTLPFIEGTQTDSQPVLSDTDWLALQTICND